MAKFLSTPSARRATDYYVPQFANLGISIHALREEGDWYVIVQPVLSTPISIHALREEGDAAAQAEQDKLKAEISIHALREEGDVFAILYYNGYKLFLSTPSARRATVCFFECMACCMYFYPRPPRGGRLPFGLPVPCCSAISIHALREEGDRYYGLPTKRVKNISIHALREEGDLRMAIALQHIFISIHALREEGDRWTSGITLTITIFLSTPSARRATLCPPLIPRWKGYFYPRPPRGGRPIMPGRLVSVHCIFLSTPSARRATNTAADAQAKAATFLSTPSARRATSLPSTMYSSFWNFYPRPPRGGRLCAPRPPARTGWISIHALREEGDLA